MYLNKFAKRLCDFMEIEHISQRKISLNINVDRKSVRLWMRGEVFPKYNALIRLAAYFNIRIDYLIGLEDDVYDSVASFPPMNENEVKQRFYIF